MAGWLLQLAKACLVGHATAGVAQSCCSVLRGAECSLPSLCAPWVTAKLPSRLSSQSGSSSSQACASWSCCAAVSAGASMSTRGLAGSACSLLKGTRAASDSWCASAPEGSCRSAGRAAAGAQPRCRLRHSARAAARLGSMPACGAQAALRWCGAEGHPRAGAQGLQARAGPLLPAELGTNSDQAPAACGGPPPGLGCLLDLATGAAA